MTDPRQLSFWDPEEQSLWDMLSEPILKVVFAGAKSGVLALPKQLQVLADWDSINHSALDYLSKYRIGTIANITKTTRDQTIKAIDGWVRGGEPLKTLEARLAPIYGDTRANRIAVTEVTRMYAEGNTMSWQSTDLVDQATFHTSEDEKVCEICDPLDGEVVDVDDYGRKPPLHTGCRCFQTPVVSEDRLREKIQGILGAPPGQPGSEYNAESVDELIDKFWAYYQRKHDRNH
jgi:SPP1 gp7 family putative phage head morphogenesis protein